MTETELRDLMNYRKYAAIKLAMQNSGKDFDEELSAIIEKLYRDSVPEKDRAAVEEKIRKDLEAEEIRTQKNCVIVIHYHEKNDDCYFMTQDEKTLYEIANIYKNYIREEVKDYTLDSLTSAFVEPELITPLTFSVFCNAQKTDERILAILEFDFEEETLSICDNKESRWRAYALEDIVGAAEYADRIKELPAPTKGAIFEDVLKGKELEQQRQGEPQESESSSLQIK